MSIERKINRTKLKDAQKNNKIKSAWRYYQIKKYGTNKWCKLFNNSRKQKNKANMATAFYV